MKRRVHIDELKMGMRVVELDRPWLDSPFLFQGFTLNSLDELNQVRKLCDYVFIEDDQPVPVKVEPRLRTVVPPPAVRPEQVDVRPEVSIRRLEGKPDPVPLERELDTARMVYKNAVSHAQELLSQLHSGRIPDGPALRKSVTHIVSSVMRNSSALLWFSQMQSRDAYVALHAIHVAVYAVALGRQLGYSQNMLVELGMGALLHDVGKLKLPFELLRKAGAYNDAERAEVDKHPVLGFRMLEHTPDIPRSALLVALQHHEAYDGSGYPRGLEGERIHEHARIVAVADRYDALTGDRPQRDGVSPQAAVQALYEMRGSILDERFVEAFIQFLGVYPVGSLVELSSGEVGIVIGNNPQERLRPKVLIVMNERKEKALPLRIVDLYQIRSMNNGKTYTVQRALDPHSYGMDLNPYIKGYRARSLNS